MAPADIVFQINGLKMVQRCKGYQIKFKVICLLIKISAVHRLVQMVQNRNVTNVFLIFRCLVHWLIKKFME